MRIHATPYGILTDYLEKIILKVRNQMTLSPLQLAGILAIVQSIIMAGFLLNQKKSPHISNNILAGLLLCFAILLTFSISQSIGLAERFIPYHKIIFIAALSRRRTCAGRKNAE